MLEALELTNRQRSLVGYSPWGPIELDMTKRLTHMLYYLSYLNPAPLDPIFSLWSQYHFSASHGESEVKVLVVSHSLLQGILPTQGSNLCLLHWQADSLPLSHQIAYYPNEHISERSSYTGHGRAKLNNPNSNNRKSLSS